jgi:hypothetical protein
MQNARIAPGILRCTDLPSESGRMRKKPFRVPRMTLENQPVSGLRIHFFRNLLVRALTVVGLEAGKHLNVFEPYCL